MHSIKIYTLMFIISIASMSFLYAQEEQNVCFYWILATFEVKTICLVAFWRTGHC